MKVRELSKEDILHIHDEMIARYGGLNGLRDSGLFDSLCKMPYQGFGDFEYYPTLYDKAAQYLYGFATNQVFIDGNKRTAATVCGLFLAINGVHLDASTDQIIDFCLRVANKEVGREEIKDFLVQNTK